MSVGDGRRQNKRCLVYPVYLDGFSRNRLKMEIIVCDGNIEKAILTLIKKVFQSGLFKEIQRNSFFATRTERRKLKDRIALRRLNKARKRRLHSEGA